MNNKLHKDKPAGKENIKLLVFPQASSAKSADKEKGFKEILVGIKTTSGLFANFNVVHIPTGAVIGDVQNVTSCVLKLEPNTEVSVLITVIGAVGSKFSIFIKGAKKSSYPKNPEDPKGEFVLKQAQMDFPCFIKA